MTARQSLASVTRATRRRDQAAAQYRAAIVQARDNGATLQAIADAAGTDRANVLRIIRRTKGA